MTCVAGSKPTSLRGQERAGLRQRLDDQHARHHRVSREVAVEVGLVARDQLARDDLVAPDLVHAIDEQERIAVRKNPLDRADIEHVAYFFADGAGALAAASPPSPLL